MIPKIIHQIWISNGDVCPIPEYCRPFTQAWQELHPEWTHRIWGNEIFDEFADDPWLGKLRGKLDEAFLSDRLRYLLLYRFGGIYSDIDVLPLRAFDGLVSTRFLIVGISHASFQSIDPSVICAEPHLDVVLEVLEQKPDRGDALGKHLLKHAPAETTFMAPQAFSLRSPVEESFTLHEPHKLGSWHQRRGRLSPRASTRRRDVNP